MKKNPKLIYQLSQLGLLSHAYMPAYIHVYTNIPQSLSNVLIFRNCDSSGSLHYLTHIKQRSDSYERDTKPFFFVRGSSVEQ